VLIAGVHGRMGSRPCEDILRALVCLTSLAHSS
jgi:hypothetical protein